MQRVIAYVGEILPDRHLFVPEEVVRFWHRHPLTQLQVTIRVLRPEAEQVQAAWEVLRQLGQDVDCERSSTV